MNDTQDTALRLATLLAWYREMGVTSAVEDEPIDWCARGELAPGAGFVIPRRDPRQAENAIIPPKAATNQPGSNEPSPTLQASRQPHVKSSPPARRAALPTDDGPRTSPPPNVRSFATSGTPAPVSLAPIIAHSLAELAVALSRFEGCGLKATAKNLCFYRGAERARVMVIGEAPGRDEDLAGKPFAGDDGRLLDRMLSAIALDPADVHVTNVVYWRPPGGRTPTAQEVQACAPFLARQIELVNPDVILLLGGAAAKAILATDETIMKVRGKWREIQNRDRTIKTLATIHPGQVLRTPSYKRKVWQDLLTLKSALEVQS